MTTATATRSKAIAPILPATLDHEELMTLLGQSGYTPSGGTRFHRMALQGGSLVTDAGSTNEEKWPPTKRGPVMTVRIVKPPVYYNAFWLGPEEEGGGAVDPNRIGRPELSKTFVKRYDDPAEQAADEFSHLEAFEAIAKVTGQQGSFKADIQLQIVPESGELTGDETVYTLSMSTTSAIDFRGSSRNPSGGVVQETNFIVQLAQYAIANLAGENPTKADMQQAVLNAMTALSLGGVVAELYLINSQNEEKTRTWTVISFRPVYVELNPEFSALEATNTTAPRVVNPETTNTDDLTF